MTSAAATAPQRHSARSIEQVIHSAGAAVGLKVADLNRFVAGLLEADLRGVDTHGIVRLPAYTRGFAAGEINPRPHARTLREKGAVAVIDGDNGLGVIIGQLAMERAVSLARSHGIGAVLVSNTNHTGMLAHHVMPAISAGMVGYFVSNGPPVMPPYGGRVAKISNNPFAYGFPTDSDFPLILDMACSAVARGKVRLAALRDEPIPLGWALDSVGQPTTDAHEAMKGVVLPMAGHKGYGLAVANEVLAAVLPGAILSADISQAFLREGARSLDRWGNGCLAMALDISAVGDADDYRQRIGRLIGELRDTPLASGTLEILLPGEPEWRTRQDRLANGIPLASAVVAVLRELATELGIQSLT